MFRPLPHLKWLNIWNRNEPCLYVSMCATVRACNWKKHYCPILTKLGAHNFSKNLRWHFFQILGNIALLTSWWPFCLFENAALSWPQICYYLFQTNKVESRLSRFSIENKNRSVNNSRPKKQTSFTKNRLLGFQAGVRGPGISPRLWSGKSFATTICWCCDDCYDSKIIWKVYITYYISTA